MKVSTTAAALSLAFTGLIGAEDVLYSQRLRKRGIDAQGNYNISFFHVNDVHAHLDEFSSSGTDCTRPERGCFGGYARIKATIDEQRAKSEDSLWLNVGDEFQGTLFYTYYGGEKIAETLNQLGFDAMTLGNHEFDGGDDQLGDFIANLTNIPIVSANIHSTNEKLNKTIKPYHIFWEKELAVIGVTTDTTAGISKPGEGTTFSDAVEAVQNAIDEIKATTNITRIAAITHIGYDKDQELAAAVSGLQLIMGGHSHTLLGDMQGAEGKYPTIVTNKDGDECFIVTAYRWGEYVGHIDVTYDENGKILAYHGAPYHLTNTTAQDAGLQAQIKEWRKPFEAFAAEVLGTTEVELDQTTCQQKECLLGDFMSDAMFAYRKEANPNVDFALINAGGVRATIDAGEITRGEVLTSFPFGNAIVEIKMSGSNLWDAIEGIVSKVNVNNGKAVTSFLQVSKGIKIQYNPSSSGAKLVAVTIGDAPLDKTKEYEFVTLDFLATGGDNFFTATKDFATLDTQDEVLTRYIKAQTPVKIALEGRIEIVNGTATPSPSSTSNGTVSSTAISTSSGATGGVSSTLVPTVSGGTSLPHPSGSLPPYPTVSASWYSSGKPPGYSTGVPSHSSGKPPVHSTGVSSPVHPSTSTPCETESETSSSKSSTHVPIYSTGPATSYSHPTGPPYANVTKPTYSTTVVPSGTTTPCTVIQTITLTIPTHSPGKPTQPAYSNAPVPSHSTTPISSHSTVLVPSGSTTKTPAVPSYTTKPAPPGESTSFPTLTVPGTSGVHSTYSTVTVSSYSTVTVPGYNTVTVKTSLASATLASTPLVHPSVPVPSKPIYSTIATSTYYPTGTGVKPSGAESATSTSPALPEFTGAAVKAVAGLGAAWFAGVVGLII